MIMPQFRSVVTFSRNADRRHEALVANTIWHRSPTELIRIHSTVSPQGLLPPASAEIGGGNLSHPSLTRVVRRRRRGPAVTGSGVESRFLHAPVGLAVKDDLLDANRGWGDGRARGYLPVPSVLLP